MTVLKNQTVLQYLLDCLHSISISREIICETRGLPGSEFPGHVPGALWKLNNEKKIFQYLELFYVFFVTWSQSKFSAGENWGHWPRRNLWPEASEAKRLSARTGAWWSMLKTILNKDLMLQRERGDKLYRIGSGCLIVFIVKIWLTLEFRPHSTEAKSTEMDIATKYVSFCTYVLKRFFENFTWKPLQERQ